MQEIIVDEGKIKCLITGKMRKETPEEYVRQEYCRILLDVYKYPKSHIDVEYPIKVGSTDKRFYVTPEEQKTQNGLSNVRERIDKLFAKVKLRFQEDNIFEANDEVQLNDRWLDAISNKENIRQNISN